MSGSDSFDGKPKSAIGYGRPPVNRQFKPGQSGNPRGRPKGQKNVATMVAETLNEKLRVRDKYGNTRRLTKLKAVCEVIISMALGGDLKAALSVLEIAKEYGVSENQPQSSPFDLTGELKKLSDRLGRLAQQPPAEPPPETSTDVPVSREN